MRIKKVLASSIAVLALAGTLAACGDDSDDDKNSEENSSQTTEEETTDEETTEEETTDDSGDDAASTEENGGDDAAASSGGDISITIDGADAGIDTSNVQCVKRGGKINVGSSDASDGFGLIMTDEATPKVESLGIMVDGTALAVTGTAGGEMGSAEVSVDGDTYTVTGTAAGADTENPTELLEKSFEIVVTC